MAQLCMSAFVGQEKEAAVSFKFLQLQATLNLNLKVSYQVCSVIDTAKVAYNYITDNNVDVVATRSNGRCM